ncbi:MAG: MMPL family transporter [Actinomycetota bacterium]|nr:MMPL family transporter [Actinomycetota bacterium]
MARALASLGRACARRPLRVVALWLVAAVLVITAGAAFGGDLNDDLTLPGTETQDATDLLTERFPSLAGGTATLVFRSGSTFTDEVERAAIEASIAEVRALDDVVAVSDPLADEAPRSPDGTIALAEVQYAVPSFEVGPDGAEDLEHALGPARDAGVQAEAGGDVPFSNAPTETGGAEVVGILAAIVILAVAFGSIVAMGVPIVLALVGLAVGMSLLLLLGDVVSVPTVAPAMASMIGIGVGIDYALFVVTRFRENLERGLSPVDAAGRANGTAGTAVMFAGGTVMIAILGLFMTGVVFVGMLGLAATVVVACAVALAVTLLPAVLGWLGHRIDRLHVPGVRPRLDLAAGPEGGHDGEYHGWARWSHRVAARPWPYLLGSVALLLTLAVPVLSLRLGMPDASSTPESSSVNRAYDLIAEGFGPGYNGPLMVVAPLPEGGGLETPANASFVDELTAAISGDDGVALVAPPMVNEAADTVVIGAVPLSAPQDEATSDLVHRLRGPELDTVASAHGTEVLVAGATAGYLDMADLLADRMVVFIGAVIALSFVLLVAVFRSLLVPLKAVVLNLLSIGAAYGVVVAVFQWGWGRGLLGVDQEVPIVSFVPILMFAILFGLSMDYHVFMLSRVREAYARDGDARESVAEGLAGTARVITSAALVMISVFAAFVLGDDPILKMLGLGLAVAILLDASIVRLTLVPSTMALLGDANWWLPGWLDRLLPHLDIEGASLDDNSGSGAAAPEDDPVDVDRAPNPVSRP